MTTSIDGTPQQLCAERTVWTATGLEPQVFLDRTGRRAGRVRLGGAVGALAAAAWLGGILSGASGFASLPRVGTLTLAAGSRPALVAKPASRETVRVAAVELRSARLARVERTQRG